MSSLLQIETSREPVFNSLTHSPKHMCLIKPTWWGSPPQRQQLPNWRMGTVTFNGKSAVLLLIYYSYYFRTTVTNCFTTQIVVNYVISSGLSECTVYLLATINWTLGFWPRTIEFAVEPPKHYTILKIISSIWTVWKEPWWTAMYPGGACRALYWRGGAERRWGVAEAVPVFLAEPWTPAPAAGAPPPGLPGDPVFLLSRLLKKLASTPSLAAAPTGRHHTRAAWFDSFSRWWVNKDSIPLVWFT